MKTFKDRVVDVVHRIGWAAFLTFSVWGLSQRLPAAILGPGVWDQPPKAFKAACLPPKKAPLNECNTYQHPRAQPWEIPGLQVQTRDRAARRVNR